MAAAWQRHGSSMGGNGSDTAVTWHRRQQSCGMAAAAACGDRTPSRTAPCRLDSLLGARPASRRMRSCARRQRAGPAAHKLYFTRARVACDVPQSGVFSTTGMFMHVSLTLSSDDLATQYTGRVKQLAVRVRAWWSGRCASIAAAAAGRHVGRNAVLRAGLVCGGKKPLVG